MRAILRQNLARTPIAVLTVLVLTLLLVIPGLASGCGGSASAQGNLATVPAQSAATASGPSGSSQALLSQTASTTAGEPTQADRSAALHERVMAEQGRGPGSTAPSRQTTTSVAGASQSTTTTSSVPPAQPGGTTTVILTGGQTPIRGVWGGTAERLASFLVGQCPSPCFTVSPTTLAEYYVYYCAEAGLRADLLWAQMIHETAWGMYGGDVSSEQNNYAGIGATGGHEPGITFSTAEAGVMAHVAHMVAYVYESSPVPWADANTDPRFDFVSPRGAAYVLADLNGRWAVPGTTYGERIEDIARGINGY